MSTTLSATAPIPLPIEACWEKLRDLSRATDYVPGLTNTVITSDHKEGVGASRVVTHSQFGDMNETVTEWDEGRGFTIRLHKGDQPATPFKTAFFRYEIRPAPGGSEIHTSLTYELPFGWLGRLADALVARRILRNNVIGTAVCLAENYQTGQPVPASELARLRSNAAASSQRTSRQERSS